ncbi:MAG: DUF4111 domain-containing protein [Caldilineaceae bacterium]
MMATQPSALTRYPEIDELLYELHRDIHTILADHLVGLYVHGSVAAGNFVPNRSDIDFVAATATELTADQINALATMHKALQCSGMQWATILEGSYIPLQALRRYDPNQADHPALSTDGAFRIDGHGSDWIIQRYLIRKQGIAVAGPPAATLIDPVSPAELRQAARGILQEWWAPQVYDHTELQDDEYQAYAILTMCRALYTVQHGEIVAKAVAARWTQQELGLEWQELINAALQWRYGMRLNRLAETIAFIRYMLDKLAIPF